MKISNLLLPIPLLLALNSYAEQDDRSSQQVYDAMKHAESMYDLETANNQCPTNDRSGFLGSCITENSKKEFRFREVLRLRAEAGEPVASFYQGVIISMSAARWRGYKTEIGINARKEGYEKALSYYKIACSAAISEACWNIADIYAKGLGSTKSGLAAVEWFYKAGLNYLTNSQREEALASFEEINKIDSQHPLASKLKVQLQKGAPK